MRNIALQDISGLSRVPRKELAIKMGLMIVALSNFAPHICIHRLLHALVSNLSARRPPSSQFLRMRYYSLVFSDVVVP